MKDRFKWVGAGVVGFVAVVGLCFEAGCSLVGIRTTEEAKYRVLQEDGAVSVREYEQVVVAETRVDGGFKQAGDEAFRRLFKYISGENSSGAKIAMTSPVVADAEGEKIAMTAPVIGEQKGQEWWYAFVLPAGYTMDSAPVPTDERVRLSVVPKKKVAVIRYSGLWDEGAAREKSKELSDWMAANGYEAVSGHRVAGYDPPWTIWFLRRNEVMVDVD